METIGIITVFAILYAFLDAWHDEKVIRRQNSGAFNWHQIDAGIKLLVSAFIGYLAAGFTWRAVLIAALMLSVRWVLFDIILNKLMQWPRGHAKGGLDAVAWYWRVLVLLLIIILNYVI